MEREKSIMIIPGVFQYHHLLKEQATVSSRSWVRFEFIHSWLLPTSVLAGNLTKVGGIFFPLLSLKAGVCRVGALKIMGS